MTYLYGSLALSDQHGLAGLLIGLLKTHSSRDLYPGRQEPAQTILEEPSTDPLTPCPTLLTSAGLRPEWSGGRRAGEGTFSHRPTDLRGIFYGYKRHCQ